MAKISIAELAKAVSAKHSLSQTDAEAFISTLFGVINSGLHNEKTVKVKGLGTFKVVDVRERESINVNTGERVMIEGHGKVSFNPDPVMRDLVNKPFAKFDTVVLNEGVELEELNQVDSASAAELTEEEAEPVLSIPAVEAEEPPAVKTETATLAEETSVIETQEEDESHEENPAIADRPQEEPPQNEVPADINPNDEETEEPAFFKRNRTLMLIIGAVLIAAIAFAGGYLAGQNAALRPIFKTVKVRVSPKPKTATGTSKAGSVMETASPTAKTDTAKPVKQLAKAESTAVKKEVTTKITTEEPALEPSLATAQRQVKTGAYVIAGTSATVTVRKGQTLKQLSKFYLGEGMECYVQVHNNITAVKEGQRLRIPQLKLKKH